MVRSWLFFAFVTIGVAGCTRANSAFCDEQTPCSQNRACDLSSNECLGGSCVANETTCSGDVLVICDGTGESMTEETCEFGCNSDRLECNECSAGAASCSDDGGTDQLTVCSDDGELLADRECFLGCRAEEIECIDVDPSNGLAVDLDFIDESPGEVDDLVLGDGFEVNSSGLILNDGTPIETVNSRLADDGTNRIRVFRVRSLHVTGDITLVGDDPIAFVSDRAIQIDGVVLVRAGHITAGDCVGETGQTNNGDRGGNGGAGHAQTGASGGDADGANGGSGGNSYGNSTLEPLAAGCDGGPVGGPVAGGMGGGGLQLVSREPIRVSATGAIGAIGQGGGFEIVGGGANRVSGGGSGGSVLIETPRFEPAPGAFVSANGGGGGCSIEAGEDGTFTLDAAQGANCGSGNGDGGDGGSENDGTPDQGSDGSGTTTVGGGGGGAYGRIRVNVADNADPPNMFFSPSPSDGDLATR